MENEQFDLVTYTARPNVRVTPNLVDLENIQLTSSEVEKGKPKLDGAVLHKIGSGSEEDDSIPTKHYPDLQLRWKNWLLRGLPKKQKAELVKKYGRKGKCPLEAPKED